MSEAVIERLGAQGDGMAGGTAYPKTLPGERVDVVSKIVLAASPDRIQPFCPVFEFCGGCKLQHWRAEPYRQWKTALLSSALRAKGLETSVNELVDAHGVGRRRVTFHVRNLGGVWRVGFMEARSHDLVPLDTCPVLSPALRDSPSKAAEFGKRFGSCDVSISESAAGLDVAVKAERQTKARDLANVDAWMQKNNVVRISINGETAAQLAPPSVKIAGVTVPLPPGAFLQATQAGEEALSELVLSGVGKAKRVADLFCGIGPFALRLALRAKVTAMDSDKHAIAALAAAYRGASGLKPVRTEARDLFHNPLTVTELDAFDAVVLDPPRAGAEAQCRNLAKAKVKTIVYASCDVQSFARDALLLASGYKLIEVTPVDQFKYTAHLEVVGIFKRLSP